MQVGSLVYGCFQMIPLVKPPEIHLGRASKDQRCRSSSVGEIDEPPMSQQAPGIKLKNFEVVGGTLIGVTLVYRATTAAPR